MGHSFIGSIDYEVVFIGDNKIVLKRGPYDTLVFTHEEMYQELKSHYLRRYTRTR